MPLSELLIAAINDTLRGIHAVEVRHGVTETSLREIKERLIELIDSDAFAAFVPPAPANGSVYYVLSEDVSPYGLYLNVAPAGNGAPAHCHGVWCVAAGFQGEELNRLYQRTNPAGPGQTELGETGQNIVRSGAGICMMPDDIHSVEVPAATPVAHVHLYGQRLDQFPQLVLYDIDKRTCRTSPPPKAVAFC